jgi:polyhydroxyalkanoate synthase
VSAATTKEKPPEPALTERLRLEVERAVQRSLKGVELFGAPPPTVGKTAKTVLHRRGTLSLYHYHATADEIYRVPLLLVMAPTNKAYILDLAPGQSLIEFLLARGYDIYLMDWNAPGDDERDLKIENYVLDFIPDCLRRVQQDSGEDEVTLVGYCAGGMLSAIHVALIPDGPVKNLVCFTTPVDFSKMNLFRSMSTRRCSTSTSSSTASASFPPTSSSPASTRSDRRAASPASCASGTTSGTTSS